MAHVGRALRLLMAVCVMALVAWSFFDVGRRYFNRRQKLAERPIELMVMHWGAPSEDKIIRDMCDAYQAQNPNVLINRINPGDSDTERHKLETMMSAGESPDVFYLPPDQLAKFARLKLVQPLDPWIEKESKAWLDDFFPELLNGFRFDIETGDVGVGPHYALPKDFTTVCMYVNTNLADAAGVDWRDIQKNGWTWDRFAEESKKITALRDRPEYAGREMYGSFLQTWPALMRNILWSFGGDFFGVDANGHADFRKVMLDSPGSQDAMNFMQQIRLKDKTSYNPTGIAKDGSQEFINGNIGFTGPVGRWYVPIYKDITAFKWDLVPMPYKTAPISNVFFTGWAMGSHTKNADEAYKLIHYLCDGEGQKALAASALAIPSRKSAAFTENFLHPRGTIAPGERPIPEHNEQIFLDATKNMRVPRDPEPIEWNPLFELGMNRAVQTAQDTPQEAAAKVKAAWLRELDSPLRAGEWRPMPWKLILTITALAVTSIILALVLKARRERLGAIDAAQERAGWMFVSPWLLGFIFLTIGPMIVSLLLAFSQWTGLNSLSHAEYVGTTNFTTLFNYDATFWQSIRVTAYFVLLGVPITQIAGLAVALLMNSKIRGVTVFRTIYFVPSVISGVALAVLWLQLFNNDYGLINSALRWVLNLPIINHLHIVPPNWFGVDVVSNPPVNDAKIWGVPAFVIMGLWGVGAGMIIYLAGLKGIPESLYEAARIDGAGPMRRLWNITLPMLSPLIFYNFVMGIIGSFQIFTQAYNLVGINAASRGGPDNALLFYVVSLYRYAFEYHNMGYASAMAWVLFVITLVLTIIVFRGSRNVVYYEGLKT